MQWVHKAFPPLIATSRRFSGLMRAKPFGTFAFPPLLCAARFCSGWYLLDANPWLPFYVIRSLVAYAISIAEIKILQEFLFSVS